MSRDDWFRNATWTPEVEQSFFARLARSRTSEGKAQYLRIQACVLGETKERGSMEVALVLLDRMLADHPSRLEVAQAHLQRAACLVELGRDDEAIRAFRASLDAERAFPNVRTQAWLDYGWFAVEGERVDLYDEVFAILDELEDDHAPRFPADSYKLHGIRAVVLAHRREPAAAEREAQAALHAATRTQSGLQHHPTLGLVRDSSSRTRTRLETIARGQRGA